MPSKTRRTSLRRRATTTSTSGPGPRTAVARGGGPYGSDEAIYGIWRLDAANVFGRNFSHVDVILARAEVGVWRVKVLQDLVFWSAPMGRMARGLKAEKAWGAFWYAMARFRQMERTGQLKGL